MKAILISIKPKWCAKIMNGEKTIEIRTSKALAKAVQKLIDEYGYADIYVYCSKNGGNLVYGTEYRGGSFIDEYGITRGYSKQKANEIFGLLNGKVIFKFRCYKVEEIIEDKAIGVPYFNTQSLLERYLCKKSCLTPYDFNDYLKGKKGYAIHISDLEIFDKPKELSEFYKVGYGDNAYDEVETMVRESYIDMALGFNLNGVQQSIDEDKLWKECEFIVKQKYQLTKAPQSFCYVEVDE